MLDPKIAKMAEELMKKQDLSKEMKKPRKNGPSLDSGIRDVPPKPRK
jgi:hypothetical protein